MTIKRSKTIRGFPIHKFKDSNGEGCSLQESSRATQHCIWLGVDNLVLNHFIPHQGWSVVDVDKLLGVTKENEQTWLANTRMHLTKKQVKELLPILTKFVEEGEL